MGKRGMHHADRVRRPTRGSRSSASATSITTRLDAAAAKLGIVKERHRRRGAGQASCKPDVFCFCTPPDVRLPLIKLGIDSGAKLIAFEKPVAMTSAEGLAIKRAIDTAG